MDEEYILSSALWSLVTESPIFLAMFLGFVIALVRWRHHPAVSASVMLAVMITGLTIVGSAFLFPSIYWLSDSIGFEDPIFLHKVFRVFATILFATAWGLLFLAAFGWRKAPQ